jgi:hypothetical protein
VEPITSRTVRFAGWAWPFAHERVRSVELRIDGAPAGRARLILRPDIAEALDLPEAVLSGFEALVALPAETGDRAEIRVAVDIHGLEGGLWTLNEQTVHVDLTEPAGESAAEGAAEGPSGAEATWAMPSSDGRDREWHRRHLGYDPWHVVVLVEDAIVDGGPAIAALDVIAERRPNLELVIPGVPPESVPADLLRRAIVATALEDRVTVPLPSQRPAGDWHSVADIALATSEQGDLQALIDTLDAACEQAGEQLDRDAGER